MKKIRVSLSFHRVKPVNLSTFATTIKDSIFGNATLFPTPPVLEPVFAAQIDDYHAKRTAYKGGGSIQKGPYLEAKEVLMGTLDQTAAYVDTVADGDDIIIITSGFTPTKGTANPVAAPQQPTGVKILHGEPGELLPQCDAQDNVDSYVCVLTEGAPLPPAFIINNDGQLVMAEEPAPDGSPISLMQDITMAIMDFNKKRKKSFQGLTPTKVYYASFFCINASGVSTISAPANAICL